MSVDPPQMFSEVDGVFMKESLVLEDAGTPSESDEELNPCSMAVGRIHTNIYNTLSENKLIVKYTVYLALITAYFSYFGYAMWYRFGDEGSWRLLVITVAITLLLITCFAYQQFIDKVWDEDEDQLQVITILIDYSERYRLQVVLPTILTVGFTVFVFIEIATKNPRNLVGLIGIAFFIISFFFFSYDPSRVKWRPVFWGLAIQVIVAILILRTNWGRSGFYYAGERVHEFLSYSDAGAMFLFDSQHYLKHRFAFQVLPVVVFFSTVVSMMYYLGIMQLVIRLVGRFLAFCLGTSPTESIIAAGNIFLGMAEAPLMIRPFLSEMTNSEIHCVMTGGFATIAGSVMAAYISFGVPPHHILTASVMSAPAALALSKLIYPETEKTRHKAVDAYKLSKGEERNIIEAASNGASMSIKLVANIAVNLIAFVALLELVNTTLHWFGARVGFERLTFQFICSYVFWPLAYLMGVEQKDCKIVGELIGIKTFLNEFIAYLSLSKYIRNGETFECYLNNISAVNSSGDFDDIFRETNSGDLNLVKWNLTLGNGVLSKRSVVISTYALCGFSNFASMGVQVGVLGAIAPNRKGDLSRMVFRAMIAGNVACFLTACIAGLFYDEEINSIHQTSTKDFCVTLSEKIFS